MRKTFFFAAFAVLLLSACDFDPRTHYPVTITNNSSRTVLYSFNGGSGTLAPSETNLYEIPAHSPYQPPRNIRDGRGIASIKLISAPGEYTFVDATPFDLFVINQFPRTITIKADNFIDNNGSMELAIERNDEATAKIFAATPNFTSLENYPVEIISRFVDNTVYVTIR